MPENRHVMRARVPGEQVDMQHNRKIILSLLIGIVFSCAAVTVSFRNIPLTNLMEYVKTINFWWIIPSTLLGLTTYLVRALRWKLILSPVKKIGFWHTFHPLVIAFTINCILPGRLGELARPAILYKRDRVEFSKVLVTVAVERIFDMATLLLLFIFIMGSLPIDPSLSLTFNGYHLNRDTLLGIREKSVLAGFFLLCLICMFMLPVTRRMIGRFISNLPGLLFFTTSRFRKRLSERIDTRSHAVLDNIALGFEVLRKPPQILACLMLSAGVWLLTFVSFSIFLYGCKGVNISFLQASTSIIILCFFIMLPSVPGYWGLWEAGGIYGLMLFGVPRMEAAGLTLTYHFFAIVPLIIIGIFSAWVTGVNIMQVGLHSQQIVTKEADISR